ncbi:MAG TPA: putative porin [Candidatus Limnocylindrales bacterium]|nr:putative porin [Candidatus Limnocylindrales bacterium]
MILPRMHYQTVTTQKILSWFKSLVKPLWRRHAEVAAALILFGPIATLAADSQDPLLNLLLQKGILTEDEAKKVQSELEAGRTNVSQMAPMESKWKINKAIKNIELYGDLRVRYENRQVDAPDGRIELDRGRYSVRLGLRGEAFDDIYYGVRLDTAANPRSPWVTFGTSTSGNTYQGPFGKSTAGINVGQVYLGWKPTSWFDFTIGKMPQPLYTTPMVWDTDLNPEGAAERFKYTVGQADLFATFGQFYYADENPTYSSGGLGFNGLQGQTTTPVFLLAWEAGINYRFTTNMSLKAAANLYHYVGLQTNVSPFFGDPYIGEGVFTGAGTANPINGASGLGTSSSIPGQGSIGFPNNQVGVNHLTVLEIPVEFNFKIRSLNARLFGDFAYNLEGKDRAEDAASGYARWLAVQNSISPVKVSPFSPQTQDVKAYQVGFGIGNGGNVYGPMQGLVYSSTSRKKTWEARTYWQHVEQYALDPNLIDSDYFEGRGNLEGIYVALAYSLTDNTIATFRYGYASRINEKLGNGGANQDVPQVNPIDHYNIFQVDLTFRF